jgi:hypothetical protein
MRRWLHRYRRRQVKRLGEMIVEKYLNVRDERSPRKAPVPSRPSSGKTNQTNSASLLSIGDQRNAERATASRDALVTTAKSSAPAAAALSAFEGGGWRYGHLRTLAPPHTPRPRSSAMEPAVVALQRINDGSDDLSAFFASRAQRTEVADMTTAHQAKPMTPR